MERRKEKNKQIKQNRNTVKNNSRKFKAENSSKSEEKSVVNDDNSSDDFREVIEDE